MTLTPHRDSAQAAAAEARRRRTPAMAVEDADGIGQRMSIEASEAILFGAADMMDRNIAFNEIWPQVSYALSNALTSFLMSASRGQADVAVTLLPNALASIEEMARLRLDQGLSAFATQPVPDQQTGRA